MAVFLIFAVPVFFGIVQFSAYRRDYIGMTALGHFFRGIGIFVPAVIIYFIVRPTNGPAFVFGELLIHNILFGHVFMFVLGTAGFALLYRFSDEKINSYPVSGPYVIFSFFSGFYSLYGLLAAVLYFPRYRWDTLFLEPFLVIGIILSITVLFQRGFQSYGAKRWIFFGAGLVVVFLASLVETFISARYLIAGAAVSAAVIIGSVFCFIVFGEYTASVSGRAGSGGRPGGPAHSSE